MTIRREGLIAAVGLGVMLNPLNSSMIAVALTRLQGAFGVGYSEVSWMIFVFYIASAVAQPVMGRLSDLFGAKKIFLGGLMVASLSSLLAPLSPSLGWLLAFRVTQAVGTSMVSSVGFALIRLHVSEKQAGALAVVSVFLSGAAAFGPALGGVLIHAGDWPVIFLVNLPLIAASFALALGVIPRDEPRPRAGVPGLRGLLALIDARGILLFSSGLVCFLVGLLSVRSGAWGLLAWAGVVLLGLFFWAERGAASPLIPLATLGKFPRVSLVNFQFLLVNLLTYSLFFGFPAYLQSVRHLNPLDTGLLMLSFGLGSLAAAPLAGGWIERSGPRPSLVLSGLLLLSGSVGMVALGGDSALGWVVLILAAFGMAAGLTNVGLQTALFQGSPKEIAGVASGLFLTSRYLGTILSSLVLALLFTQGFSTQGLHVLGLVLAGVALVFTTLLLRLGRIRASAVSD